MSVETPINSPPLRQVIKPKDKGAIVVSDVTRGWIKYSLFLPPMVDYLNHAGVPDSDISLVVSLGAHRLHTREENEHLFGKLTERVEIVPAAASDEVVCAMAISAFFFTTSGSQLPKLRG